MSETKTSVQIYLIGCANVKFGPTPTKPNKKGHLGGMSFVFGGEGGIRTPVGILSQTRFPGVRLKPLIHLSEGRAEYPRTLFAAI
jgi:hypothetical protein